MSSDTLDALISCVTQLLGVQAKHHKPPFAGDFDVSIKLSGDRTPP